MKWETCLIFTTKTDIVGAHKNAPAKLSPVPTVLFSTMDQFKMGAVFPSIPV